MNSDTPDWHYNSHKSEDKEETGNGERNVNNEKKRARDEDDVQEKPAKKVDAKSKVASEASWYSKHTFPFSEFSLTYALHSFLMHCTGGMYHLAFILEGTRSWDQTNLLDFLSLRTGLNLYVVQCIQTTHCVL